MTRPVVVGIAGKAQSGKDTLAAHLVAHYGFVRRGLADALKDEVRATLPRTLRAMSQVWWRWVNVSLDDGLTDEEAVALAEREKPPWLRALWQEWGTELRRAEDPGYWTDQLTKWLAAAQPARVVIPDIRFVDEARAVRSMGGWLVRVNRPSGERRVDLRKDTHPSETALDDWSAWDLVLDNTGTVAQLCDAFDAFVDGKG